MFTLSLEILIHFFIFDRMKPYRVLLIAFFIFGSLPKSVAQTEDLYKKAEDAYFDKNQVSEALAILNKLIQSDSNDNNALFLRSWISAEQKQYAEAIKDELVLCRRFPEKSMNWRNLAWHYTLISKPKLGLAYALKALEISKTDYRNFLAAAHACATLGNGFQMMEYYEIAAQYVPNEEASRKAIDELDLLKSMGLFHTEGYGTVRDHFLFSFIDYAKYKGTPVLDSIQSYLPDYTEYTPGILKMKKRFLATEPYESLPRYFVMRDFLWQIGINEFQRGNYLKAANLYFMESIKISNGMGDTIETINGLLWLGENYSVYDPVTSLRFLRIGLSHVEFLKASGDTLKSSLFVAMSRIFFENNFMDSAHYFAKQAFILALKAKNDFVICNAANYLSKVFGAKRQYDSAIYYNTIAWEKSTRAPSEQCRLDIEFCKRIYLEGNHRLAAKLALKKAALYEKSNTGLNTAPFYETAGLCFFKFDSLDAAAKLFTKSISSYQQWLVKTSSMDFENTPTNKLYDSYNGLRAILLRNEKNTTDLFRLAEESKANGMFLALTGQNYCSSPISLEKFQKSLKPNELAVSFNISDNPDASYILAVTSDKVKTIKLDLLSQLPELYRKNGLGEWVDSMDAFIKYYREAKGYDVAMTDRIRNAMYVGSTFYEFKKGFNPKEAARGVKMLNKTLKIKDRKEITQKINTIIYEALFGAIEELMPGKISLLIVPDGVTAILPFEVIKDKKGQYLGDKFNIVNLVSFTVNEQLAKREITKSDKILALGNPEYNNFNPKESGRAYDLAQLGYDKWNDLPATDSEIKAIKSAAKSATVWNQTQVNESAIKAFSESGNLNQFGILHFALHGMVSINNYEDNSLILTEPEGSPNDGFLQFLEIKNLKLKTNLVCLSACRTAEAEFSHDVAPNLVTAFLMAGSRSVIGTSWEIDDEGTALFMKEFYRLILSEKMTYTLALQKCRQAFLSGRFGEKYKDPYYWAAFRYTGVLD